MPPRVFPFIVTLYAQPLKSAEKPSCRETQANLGKCVPFFLGEDVGEIANFY